MGLLDDFFLDYLRKTGLEIFADYFRESGIRFLRGSWKGKENAQAQEIATTFWGAPKIRNVLPGTDDEGNPVTVPTIGAGNFVIPPFAGIPPLAPWNPPIVTFPNPYIPDPPAIPPGGPIDIPPFPPDPPDDDPDDDSGNPGPPGIPGPPGPGGPPAPVPDPTDDPDPQPPGGGGEVTVNSATAVALTTSTITAREDENWGTGSATLILYDDQAWTGGTSVTVRNSASGEVGDGKYVQLKMIAGLWFVDVEDCGADEENA